jgi:uncharacterized delta-60 repeat protein
MATPGSLDATFGTNGKFAAAISASNPQDTIVQPDGKTLSLSTGALFNSGGVLTTGIAIQRFNTNGSADTAFGSSGTVNATLELGSTAASLRRLSDGSILLIRETAPVVTGGLVLSQLKLTKYSSSGILDTSFGNGGTLTSATSFSGFIDTFKTVLPIGNKILIAGPVNTSSTPITVELYDIDGTRDTTFGTNGQVTGLGARTGGISGALLQPDGKIIIAGTSGIFRLLANGAIDSTFTNPGPIGGVVQVFQQSDGKIIVGSAGSILRLNTNGAIDNTFSTISNNTVFVLESDDKLLVGTTEGGDFKVRRYSKDGVLDNTFGTSGLASVDFGGADTIRRLNITADGQLFASGVDTSKILATSIFTGVTGAVATNQAPVVTATNDVDLTVAAGGGSTPLTLTGIQRITIGTNGDPSNGNILRFYKILGVSGDGRYVVYGSDASNLVANDTNGTTDFFLYDQTTSTNISLGNGNGGFGGISRNGRYVAYNDKDASGQSILSVYDTVSQTSSQISGTVGIRSFNPIQISDDGRYISVYTGGGVSVVDRTANSVTVIPVLAGTSVGLNFPALAPNGSFVIYTQDDFANPSSSINGLYRYDIATGASTQIIAGNSISSSRGLVSGDSRYFQYPVSGNAAKKIDLNDNTISDGNADFVGGVDETAGFLDQVSQTSEDGKFRVIAAADSVNLVPNDTNGFTDLFIQAVNGSSIGDPHITTFDGFHYDFQATGDFVLVQGLDSDLQIQVRQTPWVLNPNTTINTGLATVVDGNRIEFYVDRPLPLIDNLPLALAVGESLTLGKGSITRTAISGYGMQGDLYTITYPNGDVLKNSVYSGFLMDPAVTLANGRQVMGLLGNNNGDVKDDLALRDGTVLADPLTPENLYGAFAQSWQVTENDSLFRSMTSISDPLSTSSSLQALAQQYVFGGNEDDTLIGSKTLVQLGQDGVDLLMGNKGADTFVIGDANSSYYVSSGLKDYALITDLWAEDRIQLHGVASDYVLGSAPAGLSNGTGIFLAKDPNELVAIVQDRTISSLDLSNASTFHYV